VRTKKLIIVSGTPATGKSSIAQVLVKKLGFVRVDLHDLIKKFPKISTGYNRSKQCYDINLVHLEKVLLKMINDNPDKQLVFDSHVAHYLPKVIVKLAIIMTCSNFKKLKKRLDERKYSKKKVEENLQCEIFEVCLDEARESGHKVLVLDSAKKLTQKEIVEKVKKKLRLK